MMTISQISYLLLPSITISYFTQNSGDYCSFSPNHQLCNKDTGGVSRSCGTGGILASGVSQSMMEEIVDGHNMYRGRVARGEVRGQTSATNMRQLVWDQELARIAQAHANQCRFAHDCSECRSVGRWSHVGQNIYIYKQTLRRPDVDWTRAMARWFDEVKLFRSRDISPFKFSKKWGHYSQMMWADTSTVGCGVTTYKVGRWYQVLYTCNYGPGGNYIRGEMYKQGSACSQCPSNTRCSQQYPGLCTTYGDVPRRRISVKENEKTPQIKRTNLQSRNSSLMNCDFDSHPCNFKVRGEKWLLSEDGAGNHFYDVILSPGSNTDLRLASLVPVSRTNSGLCLYLQYKKYSPGGIEQPLHILAWPYRAVAPQKVNIALTNY